MDSYDTLGLMRSKAIKEIQTEQETLLLEMDELGSDNAAIKTEKMLTILELTLKARKQGLDSYNGTSNINFRIANAPSSEHNFYKAFEACLQDICPEPHLNSRGIPNYASPLIMHYEAGQALVETCTKKMASFLSNGVTPKNLTEPSLWDKAEAIIDPTLKRSQAIAHTIQNRAHAYLG